MARVYHRDAKGRFASGGGGSSKGRPATTKASMRGGQNRLTRDNSGRITSIGGNGATARGGRLKTAAGNQRGRQVASVKGGVKGMVSKNKRRDPNAPVVVRKAGPRAPEFKIPKPPASKQYGRGVDAAKVGRIMSRVAGPRNYVAATNRVRYAKEEAGGLTRQRAVDFLHKQGGFKASKTRGGRKRWDAPDGLTKEKAMRNIAEGMTKLPRRSTAKTGNKKITSREQKRQQKIQDKLNPPRVSYMHGGKAPAGASRAPFRQNYDGSTGRGSSVMKGAVKGQAARRQVVRTLRGLGRYNSSKIQRGVTKQRTLGGGTSKTAGKFRKA